jgi:uncharacterized membrane protein YgcG
VIALLFSLNKKTLSISGATTSSAAKNIETFTFPGLPATIISGTNITATVPTSTDVTTLAPTYTVSALATGNPTSGTARNFTTPQTYTITAQDGTTKNYTVTVTKGSVSAAKDILTFTFPGLPATTISGTNISVTVPAATNVTTLAPTYTMSALATGNPTSGTARNFTTPQTYTITAQDGTTKNYTVTVSSSGSGSGGGSSSGGGGGSSCGLGAVSAMLLLILMAILARKP